MKVPESEREAEFQKQTQILKDLATNNPKPVAAAAAVSAPAGKPVVDPTVAALLTLMNDRFKAQEAAQLAHQQQMSVLTQLIAQKIASPQDSPLQRKN
jgi:hypothetical protein